MKNGWKIINQAWNTKTSSRLSRTRTHRLFGNSFWKVDEFGNLYCRLGGHLFLIKAEYAFVSRNHGECQHITWTRRLPLLHWSQVGFFWLECLLIFSSPPSRRGPRSHLNQLGFCLLETHALQNLVIWTLHREARWI